MSIDQSTIKAAIKKYGRVVQSGGELLIPITHADRKVRTAWREGMEAGAQEEEDFHSDREPIREAHNPY